jgi:hypothetical protein
MGTLLTNPRMSPELVRRIERSLGRPTRSRKSGAARAYSRGQGLSAARMLLMLAVGAVLALAWLMSHGRERDLSRRRAVLIEAAQAGRAALTPSEIAFLPKAERWVVDAAAAAYPGDYAAPELGLIGDLDAWLARPLTYVRGSMHLLARRETLALAASTSDKDALVLCLAEPPRSSAAADVVEHVRGVYLRGAMVDERTYNVRRLHDATEGLRLLGEPWSERARSAATDVELEALELDLDHARRLRVSLATAAEGLLMVVDEAPSIARVVLVDLRADKLLLRLRREVTTDDASANARALYGAPIDDCRLALEVRRAVVEGLDPAR